MSVVPWKVLEETVHKPRPYRTLKDVLYELPNGEKQLFSLKLEGKAAAVLALTTGGEVILARQYRPGPDRILDELPGGGPEPGETFAEAAARELLEETGYRAGTIVPLGRIFECAYSTVNREGFIALDCVRVQEPSLDATEFAEPVLKSVSEFVEQLMRGECTDPEVGWMGLFHLGILKLNVE
jgi:ADP-ribose pyrophosphatase